MKYLVTGGAGFIGSNLVDALIDLGHQVIVLDNLVSGKREYVNPSAVFAELDISSPEAAKLIVTEKPEAIFHLAAQIDVNYSVRDPHFDVATNINGALNILQAAKEAKIKKIIFTSTGGAIYGETQIIPTPEGQPEFPLSPYGINKLAFEKYLNYYYQVFGLPYTVLRLANVYGPRQFKGGEAGVIANFIGQAVNNQTSTLFGDGQNTRDFVCVLDVVRALIKAAELDYNGVINIGSAQETSINELISTISKALGRDLNIISAPAKLGEQRRSCLDNALAKKILGWQPEYNLEQGIAKTISWTSAHSSVG